MLGSRGFNVCRVVGIVVLNFLPIRSSAGLQLFSSRVDLFVVWLNKDHHSYSEDL